jgi:hypothetical protein
VAILGAILSSRLATETAVRLPGAISQLSPEQAAAVNASGGASGVSINEPSKILALPDAVRNAIQVSFVDSLHTVFLVAGLVALVAVVVTVLMPDRELRGGAPDQPPSSAEMEAKAESLI